MNPFPARSFPQIPTLAWYALLVVGLASPVIWAQDQPATGGPSAQTTIDAGESAIDAETLAEAALSSEEPGSDDATADAVASGTPSPRIDLWQLAQRGGALMIPISLVSLIVVTFGLERMIALRRRRVLPPVLFDGLDRLAGQKGGLDPRRAYALCKKYPSTASRVILDMLLRLGRPHAEVEQALRDASDREAGRLYANVRWLSLAAGIAPLLGLLGTVGGMIQAFFETANLQPGANRADYLAEGIYKALVTTFAGLSVAIPAAILAHMFEGRIQRLFRDLDERVARLLPQLERFEGRLRANHESSDTSEFPRNPIPRDNGNARRRAAEQAAVAQKAQQK
jgi:biopolymer transport protein ExbB